MSEASVYSGALDVFTDKEAKQDKVSKADINKVQNAIEAMQSAMGTNIEGNLADLYTRLSKNIDDDGRVNSGSSFPGTPTPRTFFHRTDTEQTYIRNHGDSAWLLITSQTLSNTVYCWFGGSEPQNYQGATLNPAGPTTVGYIAKFVDGSTFTTVIKGRFTKFAGINTVTIHALMVCETNNTGSCKVDIGGQNATVTTSATHTTLQWVTTTTINVSGLSDGTTYDITVQIKHQNAGEAVYLYGLILSGS